MKKLSDEILEEKPKNIIYFLNFLEILMKVRSVAWAVNRNKICLITNNNLAHDEK